MLIQLSLSIATGAHLAIDAFTLRYIEIPESTALHQKQKVRMEEFQSAWAIIYIEKTLTRKAIIFTNTVLNGGIAAHPFNNSKYHFSSGSM